MQIELTKWSICLQSREPELKLSEVLYLINLHYVLLDFSFKKLLPLNELTSLKDWPSLVLLTNFHVVKHKQSYYMHSAGTLAHIILPNGFCFCKLLFSSLNLFLLFFFLIFFFPSSIPHQKNRKNTTFS